MKGTILLVGPAIMLASQFAFASGEPSSLDCYFSDKGTTYEVSFGMDTSDKPNATDDLLTDAVFYSETKTTGRNKKAGSTSHYLGQIDGAMGTRSEGPDGTDKDGKITVKYEQGGNSIVINGDDGTAVVSKDSPYQTNYGAVIVVAVKAVDATGVDPGHSIAEFPKGRFGGECHYNPGD